MPRIKHADYNKAKGILMSAGSKTAEKSHSKHGGSGDSPDGHGWSLLRDAQVEFRSLQGAFLTSATAALGKAATAMGLDIDDL